MDIYVTIYYSQCHGKFSEIYKYILSKRIHLQQVTESTNMRVFKVVKANQHHHRRQITEMWVPGTTKLLTIMHVNFYPGLMDEPLWIFFVMVPYIIVEMSSMCGDTQLPIRWYWWYHNLDCTFLGDDGIHFHDWLKLKSQAKVIICEYLDAQCQFTLAITWPKIPLELDAILSWWLYFLLLVCFFTEAHCTEDES